LIKDLPILAVTPGEPAGIGPEILLRVISEHPNFRLLAVADISMLRQRAAALEIDIDIEAWHPGQDVSTGKLSCLDVPLAEASVAGQLSTQNAPYVLETLRRTVALIEAGSAAALVTCPVHKGIINDAGIAFSGHTEFLADCSGTRQVVMMLAAPALRVALVTTHLPLRSVPDAITAEKLRGVLKITHHDLKHRFGIVQPRLQVLGLNPHAGEGGHLGMEEIEIIEPVIEEFRSKGIRVSGPVPADTAFTPRHLADCDAVVAMYHDQGLPVLKHAGFGEAVNITLGLPFIRTSVDHGTALDIADQGVADHSSLVHAMESAQNMAMRH